jgi:hypothetical protein
VGNQGNDFDPDELANSFPFDERRSLRGPSAQQLLDHCIAEIAAGEERKRQRREKDEKSHRKTVEAMLANLIAGTFNRMDPNRFAAISKRRNDYVGSELSYPSIQRAWEHMDARGWIEWRKGFYGRDRAQYPDDDRGRRSRMRATPAFRDLLHRYGVTHRALGMAPADLIRLKEPAVSTVNVPDEIEDSRTLLRAINERLATAGIALPENIWKQFASSTLSDEGEADDDAKRRYRRYAGDMSAVALYRVFNRDWDHGGRIYGSWWMSLRKQDRPAITINGRETVELDYGQLHPTILYARAGQRLTVDPYLLPGHDSEMMRTLGKRTFNRLLNSVGPNKPLPAARGDRLILPKGMKFSSYRDSLIALHSPISHYFRTGIGLRLQRADSDLALKVLDAANANNITALPIHDSFIVERRNGDKLRNIMKESFADMYGFQPIIR